MSFTDLAKLALCASDTRIASQEAASDLRKLSEIFAVLGSQKPKAAIELLERAVGKSAASASSTIVAERVATLAAIAEAAQGKAAVIKLLKDVTHLMSSERSIDLSILHRTIADEITVAHDALAKKEADQRAKREVSAKRISAAVDSFRSVETTRAALTSVFDDLIALRPALTAAEWKSVAKQLTGNTVGSKREAQDEIAAWIRSRSHWEVSHRSVEKALAEGY